MIKTLFGAVAAITVLAGAGVAAAQPYDDYQSRSGYDEYTGQRGDYGSSYGERHNWNSRDDGRYGDDQAGDGWRGSWQGQSSYAGDSRRGRKGHYRRHVGHAQYGNHNQWNWEVRVSPTYDTGYYSGY